MLQFKRGPLPDLPFRTAVKKPIPQKCVQMDQPFTVETMEGLMQGKPGDYLMIGIAGEMYVCDQEIFRQTYDLVPEKI